MSPPPLLVTTLGHHQPSLSVAMSSLLPTEVLEAVLAHCSPATLCLARMVCTQWRDTADTLQVADNHHRINVETTRGKFIFKVVTTLTD